MDSVRSIALKLPDMHRWVEVRDLLLHDACEISGVQEEPELSLVIRDAGTRTVFVIGRPDVTAVQEAVRKNLHGGEVIAAAGNAAWLMDALPDWACARIIVHRLADPDALPGASAGTVGLLDPATLRQFPIDEELLLELESGAEHSVIAATFIDGQPVSFCYAGATTESLWDIAVDTLLEHRRRGHAMLCVAYMIRYMLRDGKMPVWQALEENPASWLLARKLGFVEVDELVMMQPVSQ